MFASASSKSSETSLFQAAQSAQSLTVSSLASSLTYLDQNDKKNAVAQVKIAINNLRKIPTLPKYQVKGMTARLNKAINAIKKNDFTAARNQINHVHDELAF